jgi:hypothetical protein
VKQIPNTPIDDRTTPADHERIRRDMVQAIRELQASPLASGKLMLDVELADGVEQPVFHGLGQRVHVFVSPSGAITIDEIDGAQDPRMYVVLKATGGDVIVDLIVVPA